MNNKKGSKHFSVGDKRINSEGFEYVITHYEDAHNVEITWFSGEKEWVESAHAHKGTTKYLNKRGTFGVGYLGYGRFIPGEKRIPHGCERMPHNLWRAWVRMLERCVGDRVKNPSYEGCTFDESWVNCQSFIEWGILQKGHDRLESNGKTWQLDKDILVNGNRVYSPETCVFVPNEINTHFKDVEKGKDGYYGVNEIEPKHPNAKRGWVARCCNVKKEREYLGFYDNPTDAYIAYRTRKIEVMSDLADKWKGEVDERVINSLQNFDKRLPLDL